MNNENSPKWNASKIFEVLLNGQEVERLRTKEAIADLKQSDRSGCRRLCVLILEALSGDYKMEKDQKDEYILWTRAWLFSSLGRISSYSPKASKLVRDHLFEKNESDPWVRFYALEGLVAAKVTDLDKRAQEIINKDETDVFVRMLTFAIRASKGDEKSLKEIKEGLKNESLKWATLRALRFLPLPNISTAICETFNKKIFCNETYEAIIALGKISGRKEDMEKAALTLTDFIKEHRCTSIWDGMRVKAIRSLGNLKVESSSPILIEALTYDNPALVREAAKALRNVVGVKIATARILETFVKKDMKYIASYASALRWMNQDSIIEEELEAYMISGSPKRQEAARKLLYKMGGPEAFQKLAARTAATTKYTYLLEKTDEKIRDQFDTTIREARKGFNIGIGMDIGVFIVGILLIAISGAFAIIHGGTLDNWTGVTVTGGSGALGILYSILIANPRKQVKKSVHYLMSIKVIFLAYLRQLHQIDQAYKRTIIEDEDLTAEKVEKFSEIIEERMFYAIEELTQLEPKGLFLSKKKSEE